MVVGTKISQLPDNNEAPDPLDLITTIDVSEGRNERLTIAKLAESTAFSNAPAPYGAGRVLIWNGSDYSPADLKSAAQPKEFRGPVDPVGVLDVVLNPYDTWIDTTP